MPRARRGCARCTANTSIYRPAGILSPWQCERNHAGKDFLIIVNRLLTIANEARFPTGRVIMAAELRPLCGQMKGTK